MAQGMHSSEIMGKQNSERSMRLLAAQRQLYSDAKQMHNLRVSLVVCAGITGAVLALTYPPARPVVGICIAAALLFISIAGSAREKRKSKLAASVQEEFDTTIFSLPWNETLVDKPSNSAIAEAAARHSPKNLENWYADTETLPRPLDILTCQRINAAWGASDNRAWGASSIGALVVLLAVAATLCASMGMSFTDSATGVFAPLIPVIKELIEMGRVNLECANSKEATESRIGKAWDNSIQTGKFVSEKYCREIQDQIYAMRRSNPVIPNWFYWFRRDKNEKAMHLSTSDYVAEARARGIHV